MQARLQLWCGAITPILQTGLLSRAERQLTLSPLVGLMHTCCTSVLIRILQLSMRFFSGLLQHADIEHHSEARLC